MATDEPAPLTALPPGARFTVRVLARGADFPQMTTWLHTGRGDVEKHLRVAARHAGRPGAGPGADADAWRAALEPLLAVAAGPSARAPSTRCPSPTVLAAVAQGTLDGPLLLAQIDHLADCDPCVTALFAPPEAPADEPLPRDRRGCLGLFLLLATAGSAGWWLA